MSAPVEWALQYAAYGYRVFPIWVFKDEESGKWVKRPVAKDQVHGLDGGGGVHAATTDPDTIRRYWRGRRSRCHIGVLPPEGVVILDDDSHVFDDRWGPLTPRVQSASGKSHYYFRLDDGQTGLRTTDQIAYVEPDGCIDIRTSDGKSCVVAPSGTPRYRRKDGWTPDPARLPLLPADVYARLLEAPRKASGGGAGRAVGGYSYGVSEASIGNAYDQRGDEAERLLEEAGWEDVGGDRWIRPGGGDGSGMLRQTEDGIWFFNVHTHNDSVLKGGHFYTPTMLRCVFEFGGKWGDCYLAMVLNGEFTQIEGEAQ